jgi:cyclase
MKALGYFLLALYLLPASLSAYAQIQTQQIKDDFHVLYGPGGNIGVFTGADGIFLIDNKFAPLSEEIRHEIRKFSADNINYVINTHWHGDHTGGNKNFAADGAVIVAHEMVYRRLSMDNFLPLYNSRTAPVPTGALPTVTFTEDIRFHSGDEAIHIIHVPNAHTDTDSIVYFEEANLIQLGDLLWTDGYPRIDVQNGGGSVDGVIEALQRALALSDEETQFISGHGPVPPPGQQVVRNYLMMLQTVRNRVVSMIASGMNQQQVINARPTEDFDADWGGIDPYIDAEMFARILYISLAK